MPAKTRTAPAVVEETPAATDEFAALFATAEVADKRPPKNRENVVVPPHILVAVAKAYKDGQRLTLAPKDGDGKYTGMDKAQFNSLRDVIMAAADQNGQSATCKVVEQAATKVVTDDKGVETVVPDPDADAILIGLSFTVGERRGAKDSAKKNDTSASN